jgi:hypothetical protein
MFKLSQERLLFWLGVILMSAMSHSFVFAYWTTFPVTPLSLSGYAAGILLMIVSGIQIIKTSAPVHLLRWQFSTMVSGLLIQFGIISLYRKPDELPFTWALAIPMLVVSIYSFVESKKANGGRQLDLPTNLVHALSRLNWRWFTTPKLDFWVCWVGLLIPFALSCLVFRFALKDPLSDTTLTIFRLGWVISGGLFVFYWIRELFVRNRSIKVGNYASMNRNLGIAIVAIWLYREHGIYSVFLELTWVYWLTDMFMSAYKRSIDRQTPSGIGEYEALEGPSLGL